VRVNRRIECAHRILHNIKSHSEPIAAITVVTDRISEVGLTLVVKRHHIWIRRKRGLVLVLNLNRGSWKDEAIVSRRSGVVKRRMAWTASESADPDHPGIEHYPINLRLVGGEHAVS
jgi:hypothetical protein